ncbi:MAG: hypothetical protein ACI4WW_03295 [Candidatus Coprovivens sp.]
MDNTNKVCVDLIVPGIEEKYNVFIPINKKTIEIIFLLNKAINEMSNGEFPITPNLSLINAENGTVYDVDKNFKENNIINGTRIILL